MKIDIVNWLNKISIMLIIVCFFISISLVRLPFLSLMDSNSIFWLIIVPMWLISIVFFIILKSLEEHILQQRKILERLELTFRVEEQKRIEDPLSRF